MSSPDLSFDYRIRIDCTLTTDVDWSVTDPFLGIVLICLTIPITIIGTIWFWYRRDIQPIKARSPFLVVITDIVLGFWLLSLGFQRLYSNRYPCLFNMWTTWIGTIVLFNTYLWRCWSLYFTFHLTQEKLETKSWEKLPWYTRNRHYTSGPFLVRLFGTLFVLLLLPCGILNALFSDDLGQRWMFKYPNRPVGLQLDPNCFCEKKGTDYVLAAYILVYIIVFVYFSFSLRTVVENFRIKAEFKATAIIGISAAILWIIFNQVGSLKDDNSRVFPFSTLFLALGILAAFSASTLFPLLKSYSSQTVKVVADVPDDISSLSALLSTEMGIQSFTAFLKTEFSVENVLFYKEVQQYRDFLPTLLKEGPEGYFRSAEMATSIYRNYVISDSPNQVNLPHRIFSEIDLTLKQIYNIVGDDEKKDIKKTEKTQKKSVTLAASVDSNKLLHLYDDACRNIYNLMDVDSFPRYKNSPMYTSLVTEWNQEKRKKEVLKEMEII